VIPIREIRGIALRLDHRQFLHELGPFVLIQQPEQHPAKTGTMVMGLPSGARATQVAGKGTLDQDALAMLFRFDDLGVASLPPLQDGGLLRVGRAPDCDLVLDHGSVSKHHAQLRWNPQQRHCTLLDLGSTNGTLLNGATRIRRAVALRDGDIVGFGDVPFWYLLTPTLHERLRTGTGTSPSGFRNG
jgi:hypothetical protein